MVKSTAVKIFAVGLVLSLPTGFALAAGAKSDSKVPSADAKFVKEAAAGEMTEVELGEMAETTGQQLKVASKATR